MKSFFLFIVLLPLIGCTQNNRDYSCIDININNLFNTYYNDRKFNYFDTIKKIEKRMITDKILTSSDYNGYSTLIKDQEDLLDERKIKTYKKIKSYSNFFSHVNSSSMTFLILTECCECDKAIYNPKIDIYDSMKLDGGYPTKDNLLKVLEVTNLKNEEERLILLNFIYLNFMSIVDGGVLSNEKLPEINFGDN